jgi:hypothetical protein
MFGWNPPNVVGTKTVPIEFTESADKTVYTLTIPGVLEEKGVMKRDKNGKPLHEVPAMDLWGNKITYVDNVVFKYHDKGVGEWDLSGRQSQREGIPHHEEDVCPEGAFAPARRHDRYVDSRAEGNDPADGHEARVAEWQRQLKRQEDARKQRDSRDVQ